MTRIFVILLLFLLLGCKQAEPIKYPEIVTQEVKSTVFRHDTVWVHDSIDRYVKGDTFYLTRVKEIYRYKSRVDTFLRIDTIPVIKIQTEKVEVPAKINGLQNFLIWIGIIALAYIIIKKVILRL